MYVRIFLTPRVYLIYPYTFYFVKVKGNFQVFSTWIDILIEGLQGDVGSMRGNKKRDKTCFLFVCDNKIM